MADAALLVTHAGPLTGVQDGGRPGAMRFGVPASGPMDRASFAIANAALGNPAGAAGLEISVGGLALRCLRGHVTVAVAGGGFRVSVDAAVSPSWQVLTLREGNLLAVEPGFWGNWTYLAFAGRLRAARWLGSASTHVRSGLGGGLAAAGQVLTIADAAVRPGRVGAIPFPVSARPRQDVRVVLGPQDRFFPAAAIEAFATRPFTLTPAFDRMGARLSGPALFPDAPLDMPSEPILRGTVQVAGDGVATVLLADHQTTGGYPKIATVLGDDLDGFAQLRPRSPVRFRCVTAAEAVAIARTTGRARAAFLAGLHAGRVRDAAS